MSYNSKYKGSEVEELLDSIGNKVDKVDGKQLSTEDFTTFLKQKLDGLSNYDDTAIQESVSKLRTDLDTLVSGDTTTAIKTFNEVIAFLDGLADTEDLASIIASIEQQIAAKQDKITDLEEIRSGAAKGATALQSYTEKYTGTITGIKMNGTSKGTSGVVDLGTVITAHQDISGKQDELVSGTNIKTVNGKSLLGSGNIVISTAYPVVEYIPWDGNETIAPNTYYVWDDVMVLNISFEEGASGVANEYVFQFTPTYAGFTLSVPDSVVWVNGEVPIMSSHHTYVVSIVNNLAVWAEF